MRRAEAAVAEGAVRVGGVLPDAEGGGAAHRDELAEHELVEIGVEGIVQVLVAREVESAGGEVDPTEGFGLNHATPRGGGRSSIQFYPILSSLQEKHEYPKMSVLGSSLQSSKSCPQY